MTHLARWVEARQDQMIRFVCDLVRLASENPPGLHYPACADRIERELLALDIESRRTAGGLVVEGRYGPSQRPLYFSGHYDVVPAQTRSQFEPVMRDGLLYGRGTADMKGGIAAMMYGLAAVAATGADLGGQIVLRCVPDEETGGARGTGHLAASREIAPDATGMITAEPTGGVIWNASRGAITWRVTAIGRESHVGLWYEGKNAFDGVLDLAAELRRLQPELLARRTRHAVPEQRARASILLVGGQVTSGANFNVVPGRSTITIDRRPNPEEHLGEERARLEECVAGARARGAELEVEVIQEGDASDTSTESPLAQALAAAIEQVESRRPAFELCPGLLETRFYSARGIPALAYGPGSLAVAHGPDEHIDTARMLDAAVIYARTALAVLA